MRNVTYANGIFSDVYHINLHTHPFYELVYVTRGTGIVRIGSKIESFRPGTFTLVPPNVPHSENGEDGFQNLNLSIEDPKLPVKNYILMQDNENHDVLQILQQIVYEFHLRRSNWQKIIDGLYEVLTYILLDFAQGSIMNPYVQQIINSILNNIANANFSIADAMKNIPFHPNHIRRLFIADTGVTPQEYLINKRIDLAMELLEMEAVNNSDIQEIAQRCGYEDRNYFSRAFKQRTGLSPRNWRESRLSKVKQTEDLPIPPTCVTIFCEQENQKQVNKP